MPIKSTLELRIQAEYYRSLSLATDDPHFKLALHQLADDFDLEAMQIDSDVEALNPPVSQ